MSRPIMVAVGGDSGTGKAALCAGLRTIFGAQRCSEVRLDGYFALDRMQRNAVGLTPLDPRTHDFAAMDEDLWQLAHGTAITKPVYDHLRGGFAGSETVEPRDIVLVQGRFPLYTHVLRELFDVTVWLERESALNLAWTVHQDVTGAANERRRADYEKHLAAQAAYADVRVTFSRAGTTFVDNGGRTPLNPRAFELDSTRARVAGDGPRTTIDVNGEMDERTARALQAAIGGGPGRERLGAFADERGEHVSHALAVAQLLVARRIDAIAEQRSDAVAT